MMIAMQLQKTLAPHVAGGVFFHVLPQESTALPAVVLQFVAISPHTALCDADLDDYRVQIDVYHHEPQPLFLLRKTIENAIADAFPFSYRINSHFTFEPDTQLHRLNMEFIIPSDE